MRVTRVTAAVLALVFLAACAIPQPPPRPNPGTTTRAPTTVPNVSLPALPNPPQTPHQPEELRAIWLSFFDLMQPAGGVTEQAFRQQFDEQFRTIANFGFNTVFLHVQPFSDAIWPSAYAPWSHVLTRQQGRSPGFDPLYILCQLAIEHGLALHAWFNPFRISDAQGTSMLSAQNPAMRHIAANDGMVFEAANGWLVWNPAMPETHQRLLNSVRELLMHYPVAGIHIDDYFYPGGENRALDAAQFAAYRAQGGTQSLYDWRRSNINTLVRSLYDTVKSINPNIIVSISPAGNMDKNRNEMFADVPLWLRQPGFADWIIPQIYFGFVHQQFPFEPLTRAWLALPRHADMRLFVGLAGHKIGQDDRWAGTGRHEWLQHNNILARQVQLLRTMDGAEGFSVFAVGPLFGGGLNDIARAERDNLRNVMGG